jgi:hypothetical protein
MVGRKEKRSQQQSEVMLSTKAQPVFAELASVENANRYGVRVRTERPWIPGSRIFVRSQGEWQRGRVVYCQVLQPKLFALGLEFA